MTEREVLAFVTKYTATWPADISDAMCFPTTDNNASSQWA
jgi:hypothetical protein